MNKNHSSFIFQDDTAIVIGYCLGEYMVVATIGGGLLCRDGRHSHGCDAISVLYWGIYSGDGCSDTAVSWWEIQSRI